jgi:cephalosporin hydroxylase
MLHQSSSVAKSAKDKVTALAKGKRVMVFLDSDHSKQHVLAELNFYSTIANTYLVVEDTDIGKHVRQDFGPGPAEAVTEFLETNKNFVVDSKCERLMLTFNPGGYLRYVG